MPGPVCVERHASTLSEAEVRAALTTALEKAGYKEYRLEILDFPHSPLPKGELAFPLTGLAGTPGTERGMFWKGRLRTGSTQSISICVRVEVQVPVLQLCATHDIAAGTVLKSGDFSVVMRNLSPASAPRLGAPLSIEGMQTRRPLKSGELISPNMLTKPAEVQRGERILVSVSAGRASIGVEAIADTTARKGQQVLLTNRSSGRKFKATVTGRSRAVIRLEAKDDEITPVPDPDVPAGDSDDGRGREEETARNIRAGQNHR